MRSRFIVSVYWKVAEIRNGTVRRNPPERTTGLEGTAVRKAQAAIAKRVPTATVE